MNFLPEEIEIYTTKHSEKESAILQELNHETWEKILNPRMLSGHIQGRILSMLSHMINPTNILEIGTFTAYSTLCFAEGLAENGHIDTIDINEELQPIVSKYITKSGLTEKISCHIGNAIEIIPSLNKKYDLVFIDADKSNYLNYYNLVFEKINKGGYIIADNVLWNGKVTEPLNENDIDTKAILDFNKKIQDDCRVQNVLFPVRDGLMVIRKL
ncbi:methyltransferase [Vicingus serpentipes]|uniref:Methyltransferase n=1 Tax=Vicingus serpentipes TaxID=1926625 RepID=A0A5C6RU58_9FLAO|nr:class I SAM-dependent methyltransferase [Vicingus serpentipes]TXB65190.1 methyltransferase [Vicingus serpentipes]